MTLPISAVPEPGSGERLTDEEAFILIRSMVEALDRQTEEMDEYREYYEGEQELKYATEEFTRAFGDLFGDLKANWCEVAISATSDRLEMDRILYRDEEDGEVNEEITQAVWQVLRDNEIDDLENELYSSSMVEGRSAIIVWPSGEDDDQEVLVTAEQGQNVFVVYEDDNPRRPLMAIKKWRTELGQVNLNLFTQEHLYKYKVERSFADFDGDLFRGGTFHDSGWTKREVSGEAWPLDNPFDRIPIVEFPARKNHSELRNLTPLQDAVNKLLVNMMVAAEYASHSQAYIVSSNQPPDGGWKRRPGTVWGITPEADLDGKALPTEVGLLPSEDPSNFIAMIEHLLTQFSNLSATPGFYIFNSEAGGGRGDAPSGDSLKIAETSLIKKIERYQERYDNPWVESGNLIIQGLNKNVPDFGDVNWSNPQKHFMGMLLEEGRKMIAELQLPPKHAWRHIGLNESEIEEAEAHVEEMKAEQEAMQDKQFAQDESMQAKKAAGGTSAGVPKKTADQMKNGSTSKNT